MGEVSIYDVAKAAGVHGSTVSRAFSRPDAVSRATRERILAIAAELGYRVNPLGQALRKGSSNLVPLIVPDITNPFYGELANAVTTEADARGYRVVLCATQQRLEQTNNFLVAMDSLFAPFAIVAPSIRIDKEQVGRSSLARRMVVIDRVPDDVPVPTVTLDNERGVAIAVEHLRALGHRRIAYLTGMVGTYSGHDRLEAWKRLAPTLEMEPLVVRGGYGAVAGERAAEEFCAIRPAPTAVIASNDMAAMGFLSGISRLGMRVPDDLSIVGFDGISLGETINPPLTTVLQPIDEMARRAVDMAEALVTSGLVEHVKLDPGFVVRASTARPSV